MFLFQKTLLEKDKLLLEVSVGGWDLVISSEFSWEHTLI